VVTADDDSGSSPDATTDAYFDAMWGGGDDPWEHGTRWYEARKYGLTAAALPRAGYHRGFEPGCGAGFLTTRLAARVQQLVAMERSPRGAEVTRRRCKSLANVEVRRGQVPGAWPEGAFDLIVLSEVLYYLDDADLEDVLDRSTASLEAGGHLVAVHYRPFVEEHARTGDEVHERLRRRWADPIVAHREAEFLLEVFAP